MTFSKKTLTAAFFASILMVSLSACESEGPFEEAGEEIEEAAEDAGDAIKDATN